MSTVRNFAALAPNIGFSVFDFYDLYSSLPLHEIAETFGLVRKELARVRATAMEGSFGTQKEHYDLRRVRVSLR